MFDFLKAVTVFEKIVAREIPARIVYEDADLIAFHDIDPKAPVHVLIVPKRVISRIGQATEADAELLGKLLLAAPHVARLLGGARLGVSIGDQPRTGRG